MIEHKQGNLLEANAEALVNTVNCVGVMGKGIALQFKQAFPDNFAAYQKACKAKKVKPGHMFIYRLDSLVNPQYIINFPTKNHWKGKSRLEFIKNGLKNLKKELIRLGIQSIAIPPLGCGNGGLNWEEVRVLIENTFDDLPNIILYLYHPSESPKPEKLKIGTNRPNLTKSRALFIRLMHEYTIPGYRLSLLEIQKLAYFLQELGEPLNLQYVKGKYGPYAENLNHVLQRLEGHYIRGYGDRKRSAQIYLLPGANEKAKEFLIGKNETTKRLNQVKQLIMGFETPYGLELLSSVHWVMYKDETRAKTDSEVINAVHKWNTRKREIFKEEHIKIALRHLKTFKQV